MAILPGMQDALYLCMCSINLFEVEFYMGIEKDSKNEDNTKTITQYLRCNNLPLEK